MRLRGQRKTNILRKEGYFLKEIKRIDQNQNSLKVVSRECSDFSA
jgi:hypothetical protein